MTADSMHEQTQAELSSLHDSEGILSPAATIHLGECDMCSEFASRIARLDDRLGRGRFEHAPDVSGSVIRNLRASTRRWWSVAAAALVGLVAGALIGGVGTNLETVRAGDLGELFRIAGPAVDSMAAEVLVVERGWHPRVSERVFVGSIAYSAPEGLEFSLVDTTSYPGQDWLPNDVLVRYDNGELLAVASAPCPVAALPACQQPPFATAIDGLRPFDDGVISPLAVVGPGRVLNRWGGFEVIAAPSLDGRPTIQVETAYAVADQVQALTRHGAWRELHPSDRVVMWLDEDTLLPVRTEVYATDSPERELWALRRGYRDDPGVPILVVELTRSPDSEASPPELPPDSPSAGFVDGPVEMALPDVSPDLDLYRTGTWRLPDGAPVEVASWSDGRTWMRIESTTGWEEPRLFGIPGVFAERIELRPGSVAYLSPDGSSLAIHGANADVVITGTLPADELTAAAASLPIDGQRVPDQWEQAGVVEAGSLPDNVLVPDVEGWSVLGMIDGDRATLLLTGAGQRSALIVQEPGERLGPPDGPDFVVVDIDGVAGRYDAASQRLEWVEGGRVIALRSETVGLEELIDLAGAMRR